MELSSVEVMDVSGIGGRIASRRERLRLKQLELARLAGMSEAYINRLENGVVRNPKVKDLAVVARALGLPFATLLYGDAPESDEEIQVSLARQPRLATALASLARGLDSATPEDREFVLGHLEMLATRFGYQSGQFDAHVGEIETDSVSESG
jgi:transcriptional regulator with XRE-family HTH domain